MDNKDKSIIEKLLSIAGVEACAISSLDGDVLQFSSNNEDLNELSIKKVSAEISKLFSSYSISSIEVSSLFLSFESHNIIVNGFGSGFIFIASKKNSNVNLVKMESSYLESEFIKIVSNSLENLSSKPSLFNNNNIQTAQNPQNAGVNNINDIYPPLGDNQFESNTAQHAAISHSSGSATDGSHQNNSSSTNGEIANVVPINVIIAIKDLFANSLGPISSMIFDSKIKELNQTMDNFNRKKIEEFVKLLSKEIEDENDRVLFFKNVNNILKTIK
ncbi:MAG: roadblock/LC7 domain-containing protein [Candidatus Acididesulfobacter guangdongensis]|uniref:Roadblock/LC7 domain-containing protein n=1 Tax=Acididesulfobacter guangdongensis TaxID=2597225 RepID=A0A519BGX3_ACIG2|nr:MAG: roadblock/LC7 domain-containing protein [Candidatus Acididesulfobacter guangdongensis]